MNKRGKIAITEVLILIIAIFAFAWMIGNEIKGVKGLGIEGVYQEGTKKAGSPLIAKAGGAAKWIGKNFVKAIAVAAIFYTARGIARQLGLSKKEANLVGGLTAAAQVGTPYLLSAAGETAAAEWIAAHTLLGINPVTLGIFVIATAVFYKDTKTKTVVFNCRAWQAPSGGSKCEQCNKNDLLPCSEYQCRALGQGCKIVEGKCIWDNKNDKDYPILTLDNSALLEGYEYKDKTSTGVKVVDKNSADGCVKAFTPITFGVTTNEVATCKADYERNDFADMLTTVNRGYNHTIGLALPTADMTDDTLVIQNGGNWKIYISCQDENGNTNPTPFIFSFCVDQGPDKEDPVIIATSMPETSPYVGYDTEEIDFRIGVNEPAYCKWSTQPKSYDDMENTMNCGDEAAEMNLQMLFQCSTKLTGIQKGDNKFYFSCKDLADNKNKVPLPFTIKRTQEKLAIEESYTSPQETVRGSTTLVEAELKVKTLKGANEGNAKCYYGETDDYEGGLFFDTNSYVHSQILNLEEGVYKFYVKCIDAGGGDVKTTISFEVESDQGAPTVVRVFKTSNDLEIATSEKADCVYSTNKDLGCNYLYTTGLAMISLDGLKHSVGWDTSSNYYIKCKDDYGNQPASECSIIIKPSEF